MIERVINTTSSIYKRPEPPKEPEQIDDTNNSSKIIDEDGVED